MDVGELRARHPEYRKAVKQLQGEAARQGQMPLAGKHVWRAKVLQRVHETREELAGVQQRIAKHDERITEHDEHITKHDERITKLEHEIS